jgi:hypothetical protein
VSVEQVGICGNMGTDVESWTSDFARVQCYQRRFRYSAAGRRYQRHPMAELGESPRQPDHDALGSAVPSNRQATVGVQRHMHGGAMYGRRSRPGNRRRRCSA